MVIKPNIDRVATKIQQAVVIMQQAERIKALEAVNKKLTDAITVQTVELATLRTLDREAIGKAGAVKREIEIAYDDQALLHKKIKELRAILENRDSALANLMNVIPACEAHGPECIPNAVEWIRKVATLAKVIGGK